ncbi:MAG: peptide-methionine (R)-S-oxide reductase MsrB [Gallionella sp.]|nr:peptide-methionine (R)-S-oxide reductase MsrB [Gallionella sp.]OIO82710.1 MAG: peptide-methionine (R)-S-oxide reductase [Gallionellaceae bacterium CG1_02_56_997]PIR10468.1 MAG: peptide-methionine (R)-S-oxide reductase [Gallionellaceae bacterium CG11_big_fil_rev_8_21_14_0_20_60_62]PIV48266.1 MAG: peptide-methionine (R)-S-oxide reductase [Gallionellaceae bacterium CG02_land_8_20_14_3_00_60_115]PIY05657.1 MAG: peptide-methionine (R)-S-oxide reductase [Gallionellaceae bacterium CG_4_10_14_3_um_f
MKRRNFLQSMMGLALILLFPFAAKGTALVQKLNKSKTEWRALLPRERYEILFEEATERAGSSALNREKRAGTFICAACSLPLFSSAQKYDSGTGWPSFWQSLPNAVASRTDYKLIYPRTEYHCARCGGHQGHVFGDGPQPTGLRYCNNGLALEFIAEGTALPALRA